MGGSERESEFGEDGDDGDDDDDDDEEEGREEEAPRRRPAPRPPIPATLLTAGPRAPPELYALDERKNLPGAHYRIRFPPTAKLSRRLEEGEGGSGGGGGGGGRSRRRSSSALSSLAAAASAWVGRPSLLSARLMTGGGEGEGEGRGGGTPPAAEAGREGGDEALRRLVREGIDWGWLSSLAGNDGDDGGNDGDDGGNGDGRSPPPPPPPSPSCWLPPSAIDCEWAGGGGAGPSSSSSSSSAGAVVVLPASYATHDRVFAQVRGTRRVLVATPTDALEK